MANRDLNPQNGLQGSSYLYKMGTSPNSRTVTSQKVRILAPAYGNESSELLQIGVMANFAPSESRTIETVRGLGFGDTVGQDGEADAQEQRRPAQARPGGPCGRWLRGLRPLR